VRKRHLGDVSDCDFLTSDDLIEDRCAKALSDGLEKEIGAADSTLFEAINVEAAVTHDGDFGFHVVVPEPGHGVRITLGPGYQLRSCDADERGLIDGFGLCAWNFHHVFADDRAYGEVEAIFENVDVFARGEQRDFGTWMCCPELGQARHDDPIRQKRRGGHAERLGAGAVAEVRDRVGDGLETFREGEREIAASVCQLDVAALTGGEAEAEVGFKRANLLGNGGVRNVEGARGTCEAALFRSGVKGTKGSESGQGTPISQMIVQLSF